MPSIAIDPIYLTQILEELIQIPSPTGLTQVACDWLETKFSALGLTTTRTRKGAVLATASGRATDRPRAMTAHVDTLGAMVAEIKPSGRLRLAALNGLEWNSIESEGVWIHTRGGKRVRGHIVLTNGAAHVNKNSFTTQRGADTLEVRIDEVTHSPADTRKLGIEVGDFVDVDTRFQNHPSGYITSRFLDDKACVACLLSALHEMNTHGIPMAQTTTFLISNFEEVGHGGMDSLPADLHELVVLDMACIGHGQNGSEHACSICLKDSSGPYSHSLSNKLRDIATREGIDLKPDIYPYYGSDGSAYWRSGGLAQVALIGPGVDNSHCYERTHIEALTDTAQLIQLYLSED